MKRNDWIIVGVVTFICMVLVGTVGIYRGRKTVNPVLPVEKAPLTKLIPTERVVTKPVPTLEVTSEMEAAFMKDCVGENTKYSAYCRCVLDRMVRDGITIEQLNMSKNGDNEWLAPAVSLCIDKIK